MPKPKDSNPLENINQQNSEKLGIYDTPSQENITSTSTKHNHSPIIESELEYDTCSNVIPKVLWTICWSLNIPKTIFSLSIPFQRQINLHVPSIRNKYKKII